MRKIITIAAILFSLKSLAQKDTTFVANRISTKEYISKIDKYNHENRSTNRWILVTDSLRTPKSYFDMQTGMAYINHYTYVMANLITPDGMVVGYKMVYVYNGYYKDDDSTMGRFLDLKFKPLNNVLCFNLMEDSPNIWLEPTQSTKLPLTISPSGLINYKNSNIIPL